MKINIVATSHNDTPIYILNVELETLIQYFYLYYTQIQEGKRQAQQKARLTELTWGTV